MRIFYLLLLFTITSNAQFGKYLTSFNKATNLELTTKIVYGDFEDYGWKSNAAAIASMSMNIVVVNKQKWSEMSSSSRWAVMYHELAHIIGYRHTDDPDDLMYYIQRANLTQAEYFKQRNKFLKRLAELKSSR